VKTNSASNFAETTFASSELRKQAFIRSDYFLLDIELPERKCVRTCDDITWWDILLLLT